MPAATEQPAAKKEREELLWQSLKEHVMRERQKIKEEQEAEVEEERLRKEREERDRQDAMTLGETKEQIQILNTRLKELRNEKQQLFLRLKKVLNEDENRKKQQQQKDSEMFAIQSIVQQQGSHQQQIFLPPRAPHQQLMQKYLQSGPPPMSGIATPPNKRGRSPSPTPQYYKTTNPPYSQSQKHEDGRRGGEIARTVLWNKPTYQNPPGTLYYPSNSQDSRQSIVYPAYAPNLNIPMISPYHTELAQQQAQSQSMSSEQANYTVQQQNSQSQSQMGQHQSSNQQPTSQSSNQSHDKGKPLQTVSQHSQPPIIQQSSHGGPPSHKQHTQQISLEKLTERGYHLEKQQQTSVQQPTHITENIYRMPMSLSSGMLTISPQNQQQMQNMKPSGSITQGYMNSNNTINRAPPSASHQQQMQSQSGINAQMHYHRY